MSKASVGLQMIVKDAEDHLEKTIVSAMSAGFDELVIVDTGSTDGTVAIAERYADRFGRFTNYEPIEIDGKKYLSDFAAARNYARILGTTDYFFFIDADDLIFNPQALKEWMEETVRPCLVDGFMMAYDYTMDRFGQCLMRHGVIRCATRNGHLWRSPIHEVICSLHTPQKTTIPETVSRIIHDTRSSGDPVKLRRNARVAEYWIERLPEDEIEPRLWLNYGKSLYGCGDYDRSIGALQKYLDGSHWNEERYIAHLFRSDAYLHMGRHEAAFEDLFRAIRLFPKHKDAYLHLGKVSAAAGEWENALSYADQADAVERHSDYQYSPLDHLVAAHKIRAIAHFHLGQFRQSVEAAEAGLAAYPLDAELMEYRPRAAQALRQEDVLTAYKTMEFMLEREGDLKKLESLTLATPRCLENEPESRVAVTVSRDRIRCAIFCGEGPETWGNDSHQTTGIGGSETAVIHMSRFLAEEGFSVEVYGFPGLGDDGDKDGVQWLPYWRYFKAPQPDIFISWRGPAWVNYSDKARLRYVWLHDVQNMEQWNPQFWESSTAVMFLSEAHRQTAPWIPQEKCWLTRNGVDESFFRQGGNKPRRVIYASGPDRGLPELLDLWPQVLAAHPSARLDVYYGFSPLFRKTMEKSAEYRRIYERTVAGVEQPGVHWHGRVNQAELANAFAAAGVWAYPTSFPEISCITAMQAQVNGAIPVCTGYAALAETVRHGIVIGDAGTAFIDSEEVKKRWTQELILLMGDSTRQESIRSEMVTSSRSSMTWRQVAKDWAARFAADFCRSSTRTPAAMRA